mmetsp:Transcript_111120/g.293507  ORF Transcript_111120/g.293507 Transcript_111120/m.293507 type:complete len:223 (+) Transcript_111120:235-903(+)
MLRSDAPLVRPDPQALRHGCSSLYLLGRLLLVVRVRRVLEGDLRLALPRRRLFAPLGRHLDPLARSVHVDAEVGHAGHRSLCGYGVDVADESKTTALLVLVLHHHLDARELPVVDEMPVQVDVPPLRWDVVDVEVGPRRRPRVRGLRTVHTGGRVAIRERDEQVLLSPLRAHRQELSWQLQRWPHRQPVHAQDRLPDRLLVGIADEAEPTRLARVPVPDDTA